MRKESFLFFFISTVRYVVTGSEFVFINSEAATNPKNTVKRNRDPDCYCLPQFCCEVCDTSEGSNGGDSSDIDDKEDVDGDSVPVDCNDGGSVDSENCDTDESHGDCEGDDDDRNNDSDGYGYDYGGMVAIWMSISMLRAKR